MNYLMRLASRAAQSQPAAVFDASGVAPTPRPSLRSESPLVRADQRLHLPELAAVAAVGQSDFSEMDGGEEAIAAESATSPRTAGVAGDRAPNAAPEVTIASSSLATNTPFGLPELGAADVAGIEPSPVDRAVEQRVEVVGPLPSVEAAAPRAPDHWISTEPASPAMSSPAQASRDALHEAAPDASVAEPSIPSALAKALEAAQAWLSQGTESAERSHISAANPQPVAAPRFADTASPAAAVDEPARPLGLSIGQIRVEVVTTPPPQANAQKNSIARSARAPRGPVRAASWGTRQAFGWRQR